MKKLFLALSILGMATAYSSETDQFMAWEHDLKDVTSEINEHFNREYSYNLEGVNHRFPKSTCEQATFQVGLQLMIKGIKLTETWVQDDHSIDQWPFANTSDEIRRLSIYRDSKVLIGHMAPTININGVYLGTDKLSHALGMGYTYWMVYVPALRSALKKGLSPAAAEAKAYDTVIKYGVGTEKYITGLINTGVFSFGDLEANYQGFEFYKSFCYGPNPRLKKVNNRWVFTRQFDAREIVNPKWDETFNPSTYTKKITPQVKLNMAQYCDARNSEWVKRKMAYYNAIDFESPSSKQIKKMIIAGEVPNPAPYRLDNICTHL